MSAGDVIYRPRGPDREILARGHENAAESHFHDRGQVSPYPDRARPVNNVFIFCTRYLIKFIRNSSVAN